MLQFVFEQVNPESMLKQSVLTHMRWHLINKND